MVTKKPKGLGLGLEALLGPKVSDAPPADPAAPSTLSLDRLRAGKYQPRTRMDEGSLYELAESIKAQGVMQPVLVRPVGEDRYEIIAGERRWRAAQRAGLTKVPVVVKDTSTVSRAQLLEWALIENVQREDLNAMEEAQGYHALADEYKRSQEDIARIVGKSRSHVANMMRLTKLPAEVQAYIAAGQLSAGHARALIGVPDPLGAAKRIVEEGLNVRQTEALAHEEGVPERKPQKARGAATASAILSKP